MRGGRIGMIFQEPATSLNPVMRIGQQIVEAIEAHTPLRGAAARAKAIDWLQRVGIPEPERRIDEYPFRMSGGQKQRVMIAIALAAEPDFLVADEPTTALDVTIQAQILDLLKDLQREKRMGLLLITHDLAVVAGMAHRVALMYAGQIIEVAPAAEFFAAPRHPYARALLRALPRVEARDAPLEAIAGTVPPLTQAFTGCRFAPRCALAMPRLRHDGAAAAGADAAAPGAMPAVSRRRRSPGVGCRHRAGRGACAATARRHRKRCALRRALAGGAGPARALPHPPRPAAARARATSTPSTASRSRSGTGRRWRWWASPAAARRPPARPSCSCCATWPTSRAARCWKAATCSRCRVPNCWRRGARCRSSSRTRSRR